MPERTATYNDPNVGVYDGEDRIMQVPMAAGTAFRRRGGKAVDLHHRYQAATAASSNLAGFAEVEEVGYAATGRPPSVADGDLLPVNMSLHKSQVFPTTGRAVTMADRGKDFDLYVDANGVQFVNLGASVMGVLRISRIPSADGNYASCVIPPDLRYGSE